MPRPSARVSGVILIATAVLLAFNVTDGLQRAVPGYTAAVQDKLEANATVRDQLNQLKTAGAASTASGDLKDCAEAAADPESPGDAAAPQACGAAPDFAGITQWLNTPGGKPLTMAGLRGKVVLIDFWTYSCINCQRTLPHVEAWAQQYASAGLVVVGVHTPEFAFEHVPSNVASEAASLGVKYPVAIDNSYATWNEYDNQYWPAEYLVDATGEVRHIDYGEGSYDQTENLIRELLGDADPQAQLPGTKALPDTTPTNPDQTAETYLGSDRLGSSANEGVFPGETHTYPLPATVPQSSFALGGSWTIQNQYSQAGAGAVLQLRFDAQHVYLVLGGSGTVRASVDGGPVTTIPISGPPKLYTMASAASPTTGLLTLQVSSGVQAYDFTFG